MFRNPFIKGIAVIVLVVTLCPAIAGLAVAQDEEAPVKEAANETFEEPGEENIPPEETAAEEDTPEPDIATDEDTSNQPAESGEAAKNADEEVRESEDRIEVTEDSFAPEPEPQPGEQDNTEEKADTPVGKPANKRWWGRPY